MKKRFMSVAIVATICGSVLFTSCIGSFGLTNKVLSWNKSVTSNKFVNELLFIVMHVVPVYEISILADILVINSIEFWTGDNPVEAGIVKTVQGENGIYTVETLENGYHIQNQEGNEVDLIYDKATNTWSAVANGETAKLITVEDENNAIVYLPNGGQQRVELSQNGTLALQQTLQNSYLAAK